MDQVEQGVITAFIGAFKIILTNKETSPIGYLFIILILATFTLAIMSTLFLRVAGDVAKFKSLLASRINSNKNYLKKDVDVPTLLKIIRKNVGASKVLVLEYHRDPATNNLKISVLHECAGFDASLDSLNFGVVDSSFLGDINKDMFLGRYVFYNDIKEMNDNNSLRYIHNYLMDQGVYSVYFFSLPDSIGEVIGVALIQYNATHRELALETIRWLYERFVGLGALLTTKNKNK